MQSILPGIMFFILLVAGGGCAAPAGAGKLTEIKVTSRGSDPGGEFCIDFRLEDAQARSFFARAVEIDATQLHELDVLPCFVRGTANLQGRPVIWTVRAGGTAEIATESAHVLMACTKCDDLLGGKTQ